MTYDDDDDGAADVYGINDDHDDDRYNQLK